MARIESPSDSTAIAEVDKAMSAMRVTLRPMQSYGAYRMSLASGALTGLAAGNELTQIRWSDPNYLMLIHFLKIRMIQVIASTTATEFGMEAVQASSYSAQGSSQASISSSALTWMKRSTFPQSRLPVVYYANTGALTAGTRTLGTSFVTGYSYAAASSIGNVLELVVDMANNPLSYPLVLAANEGLIVRNLAAFAPSAQWRYTMELAWTECTPAQFPTF